MYARHFGLSQLPFSIAPDPRFLFMSERHREALAHLLYGVRAGGGFVVLTGEVGAGKTTICRSFLAQVPERCDVAYIFNPRLTVEELLASICAEFGIASTHSGAGPVSVKDYVDALNEYLLRTHAIARNNVLIIDEAQGLSADVLEQLRLLTNLETNERKLLQILLIGQPELREMLARPDMQQLSQRVIARYHLDALGRAETAQYVRHRMTVAGLTRPLPFDEKALRRIHRHSRGVPRRINLLCDRALLGAYARGETRVDSRTVDQAAREVLDRSRPGAATRSRYERAVLVGLGLVAGAAVVGALALLPDRAMRGVAPAEPTEAPEPRSAASPPASTAASTAAGNSAGYSAGSVQGTTARATATATATAAQAITPIADPSAASPSAAAGSSASAPADRGPSDAAGAPATPPVSDAPTTSAQAFDLPSGFASLVGAEKASWKELAREWNVDTGDEDPCRAAKEQQVHCYRGSNMTLALIRQLDRPGVLILRDADNRAAYAQLTGLSSQAATLRIEGAARTVSLVALADYWRGEFATFWRAPPGYSSAKGTVLPGAGERWLARRLAVARGDPPPTGSRLDEATLRGWVHAFQLAQGLPSDGIAGPITLMHLNRATGIAEPQLVMER